MLQGMDQETKIRENRLRRMAERRGLRLIKSRKRDPMALEYGRYHIEASDGRMAEEFPTLRGFTLDEIEERLTAPYRR
jgi:hypothetical protein